MLLLKNSLCSIPQTSNELTTQQDYCLNKKLLAEWTMYPYPYRRNRFDALFVSNSLVSILFYCLFCYDTHVGIS